MVPEIGLHLSSEAKWWQLVQLQDCDKIVDLDTVVLLVRHLSVVDDFGAPAHGLLLVLGHQ